jgi:hypothetical protein
MFKVKSSEFKVMGKIKTPKSTGAELGAKSSETAADASPGAHAMDDRREFAARGG